METVSKGWQQMENQLCTEQPKPMKSLAFNILRMQNKDVNTHQWQTLLPQHHRFTAGVAETPVKCTWDFIVHGKVLFGKKSLSLKYFAEQGCKGRRKSLLIL